MSEHHAEPPVHVGADDVHAHPRHTGSRWFDTIMAVCAIFISAVSLAVAIEHGRTERDLVAANSWPFLQSEISNSFGPHGDIVIGVSNAGVGPAKVRSFELSLDGQPINSPGDLLARCCGVPRDAAGFRRLLPRGTISTSLIDGTVLRAGDANHVLVVPRQSTDPAVFARLDAALTRLRFRTCFCSVLDRCWQSNLETLDTKSVAQCPAPAHPYVFNGFPRD